MLNKTNIHFISTTSIYHMYKDYLIKYKKIRSILYIINNYMDILSV